MFFARLFRRAAPAQEATLKLYEAIMAKARDPAFYARLAVPDTVNGRFDMVVIHAMLVLRRLRDGGGAAEATGKALLELLFKDMDQSLREMGVGDMGVGRHIKRMAKALFGRAEAYESGLDGDAAALGEVLQANLYRQANPDAHQIACMADYLRRAALFVGAESVAAIIAGNVSLDVPVVHEPVQDGEHHAA